MTAASRALLAGVLAAGLLCGTNAASADRAPRSRLDVVVLGSGGPRAFGRAGTSYLVLVDGVARILVDVGPGAFVQLGKLGIDLERVDIVLLSHLHIDHTGDLPAVFLDRALTSTGPIVFRVFGPRGAAGFPSTTRLLALLFEPQGAYPYAKSFGADAEIRGVDLPIALDAPPRVLVAEDGLRVRAIATHHGDAPSIAYRVDHRGESVTFAGDLDASALPNLQRLATGTDLLVLHEAVLDPPGSPARLYALHTAPHALGAAARDAGARRVLLAHIAPAIERRQREVIRSIRASFKGRILVAHDGMRIRVGAGRR